MDVQAKDGGQDDGCHRSLGALDSNEFASLRYRRLNHHMKVDNLRPDHHRRVPTVEYNAGEPLSADGTVMAGRVVTVPNNPCQRQAFGFSRARQAS